MDDWFTIFGLLGVGTLIFSWGIIDNWNFALIIMGLVLGGSSILGTPEFRPYLKLTVNRVSGKEIFQIQGVHDSTVYQGGTHYHEAPPQFVTPQTKEVDWLVDEAFVLGGGEHHKFKLELEEGDRLLGYVEASSTVTAYLMGLNSYRSFIEGREFDSYWGSEEVTRTKVSYESPQSRTFYFIVGNKDEDEDRAVSVEVKLRIEPKGIPDPLDSDSTMLGY